MQEILDSIRRQDGQSDVRIESEALESVMTALDARHLWGSYHPAMGLKARVDRAEGASQELRDQVRKARQDEEKAQAALARAKERCEELEEEVRAYREEGICISDQLPSLVSIP